MSHAVAAPLALEASVPAAWRPMLARVQALRERATRPPLGPLRQPWEEIGPGYCYGPAFGHWDIVHQICDAVGDDPAHARMQLENNLALQQADGMIPGCIWLRRPQWTSGEWFNPTCSHPPVWPAALDAVAAVTADRAALLRRGLAAALAQLAWFARERSASDGGYFYTDIRDRRWESGVDEGVRFDDAPREPLTCIDATSHVHLLAARAAAWAAELGESDGGAAAEAARLATLIRERLWCTETGFFHDAWAVADPARRRLVYEGFWPVIVGAASAEQAATVIAAMLDPARFNTIHPLATVARSEPAFSLRMWRGPAWNSMTWWAATGCVRYDRTDAARTLLGRALDASAACFARTGCIWEFYHPDGGDPMDCARKPQTPYNHPCRDYLGHNPLRAMARLWLACG